VRKEKKELMNRFNFQDIDGFDEYVGCKVKINKEERLMKFTQSVILQSFQDEFQLPKERYDTPAEANKKLIAATDETKVGPKEYSLYRTGTGKLMHLRR
jgi:hypothetical protein